LDRRILDAALAEFARTGVRRASVDDIARNAKINRTTLHRRMGPKRQLARAAINYECHRVMAQIAAQIDPTATAGERAAHGFVLTVSAWRAHPLIRAALTVDPDEPLTWLTRDGADILTIATNFVTAQIREGWTTTSGLPAGTDPATVASIIVRLGQSLVLTPDAPPSLGTSQELWDFASTYIAPLVTRSVS
jgi:AcrR family transcriptional regulator